MNAEMRKAAGKREREFLQEAAQEEKAELTVRREVAVDELMQCRKELAAISVKTLELVGEIDESISSNLRLIGVAEPEAIVVELERLAEKVGGKLSEGF